MIYEECALKDDMTDFEPYFDQFIESNLFFTCVSLEDKDVDGMMDLCKRGNLKLLAPLIQRSKDKNPGDKDKYTILHCATEHGHLNIVQYLLPLLKNKLPKTGLRTLSNGFTVRSETPLHLATRNGHLSIIEFMVPHLNGDINPARGDGMTVLHVAAIYGHINIVTFYTSNLDNPNPGMISNDEFRGRTPLHHAAQQGHLEVVKHLCNLLQNKNPSDDNARSTPLHWAANYGHINIEKYLVTFLDNKHPKSRSGRTPLDYAKDEGKTEVVNFLENL